MSINCKVMTPTGSAVGTRVQAANGVTVDRYKAISYGRAPVGALRWARPEPAEPTSSLNEGRQVVVAPQLRSRLENVMGALDVDQSEDCLQLSIWVHSRSTKPLPVVIWFHGGAWQSGGGAVDWYAGEHLAAAGNLIVVGVNYRLGPLGWLALPDSEPNLGLLDQELAIAWVTKNIEFFGGDPSRITLMGQSAGAGSIACLLVRNSFPKRAIMQSAALARGLRTKDQAKKIGEAYLDALHCDSLEEARKLSVTEVLSGQESSLVLKALLQEGASRSMFAPVSDGAILPLSIDQKWAQAAGRSAVLIGHTNDEMLAFGQLPEHQLQNGRSSHQNVFEASTEFWSRSAAAHGGKAWTYRFEYAPSVKFKACHCAELPFVFGTLAAFANAPMTADLDAGKARFLIEEIQHTWTNFINGIDPAWTPGGTSKVFR